MEDARISIYLHAEGFCHEDLTLEELISILGKARKENNIGVVRGLDDRTFFRLAEAIGAAAQKALSGAGLIGGAVAFWNLQSSFPDGDGWRVIVGTAAAVAQPNNGMRSPGIMR
jgi:hypothetical protein